MCSFALPPSTSQDADFVVELTGHAVGGNTPRRVEGTCACDTMEQSC